MRVKRAGIVAAAAAAVMLAVAAVRRERSARPAAHTGTFANGMRYATGSVSWSRSPFP
jgi:hypothetical protein